LIAICPGTVTEVAAGGVDVPEAPAAKGITPPEDFSGAVGQSCHRGASEPSGHSRDVAEGKDEIRRVSAWFDDELTKLEGAE
jgi:hypothetical protein